jgi:predicted AlkP superfamily phosphohydrolase/phosphomutase
MPNLRRLIDNQGSIVDLETTMPPHSPVAWASIATGTNPGKHNIFDFIRRDPKTYLPQLSLSKAVRTLTGTHYESYVKADPFWKVTSDAEIHTSVIRWPVTFPAEEVTGMLLSGLGVPDIRGLLSGYTFYTTERLNKEKSENEKAEIVESSSGVVKTTIKGPRGSDRKPIEIPMTIRLDNQKKTASFEVQDNSFTLTEGSWSPWLKLKFSTGMLDSVSAVTMMYLDSVEPELKLYMGAIEIDPAKPAFPISHPPDFSKQLVESHGLFHTLGLAEETAALTDGKISEETFLEQIYLLEKERTKIFETVFEDFRQKTPSVMAMVFDSGDRVQHMFWNQWELRTPDREIHPAIQEYFRIKDKWLGDVLKRLPKKTAVMVISDHGFSSFERAMNVNKWLIEEGFMEMRTGATPEQQKALFRAIDWSRTVAYSVGFNSIYLNVIDREGKGILNAEAMRDKKREISKRLLEYRDPVNGRAVVNRVFDGKKIYSGPEQAEGPDLVVGFNPGYRMAWQSAIGGITDQVLMDNEKHWRGDHLIDFQFVPGVLITNFRLEKANAHQMDVIPTLYKLLGLPGCEGCDGKALVE